MKKSAHNNPSNMNIANHADDLISFSLTRMQRLFGRPLSFLYISAFVLVAVIVPLIFFALCLLPVSEKIGGIMLIALLIDLLFFFLLFWHGPLMSLLGVFSKKPYINTFSVNREHVLFGFDGLQVKRSKRSFSVIKGNFGTILLRSSTGNAFLVPSSAVTFEKLENILK